MPKSSGSMHSPCVEHASLVSTAVALHAVVLLCVLFVSARSFLSVPCPHARCLRMRANSDCFIIVFMTVARAKSHRSHLRVEIDAFCACALTHGSASDGHHDQRSAPRPIRERSGANVDCDDAWRVDKADNASAAAGAPPASYRYDRSELENGPGLQREKGRKTHQPTVKLESTSGE